MAADQQAIEHEFNIRRSTTTIILQRMEKRGLVQRITDPHDRRRRQVQLTAIARELVPAVQDYIRKQEGLLTNQFSPAELIITARVLKYIKEAN